MFNFRETKFVPGFRVRDPKENVPGFRVAPDGLVRGSATDLFSYESIDPTRGSWLSDHFLNANDRFAGNPYLGSGLASQPGEVAQNLSNQNSDWNYPKYRRGMSPIPLGRSVTHVVLSKPSGAAFPTHLPRIADACARV
jgi:hypothetical protein